MVEESQDDLTKSTYSYTSEGPPSELARDINPGLDSSSSKKNKKAVQTPSLSHFAKIPDEVFVRNVNPTWEIMMSIKVTPLNQQKSLTSIEALLDSSANAIFIN